MKRVLLAVALVAACSTDPTPQAAPSTTPSFTQVPTASTAPTPAPFPTKAVTPEPGPVGTAVPKGFSPRSATFVSAQTGWVLGSSAGRAVVVRTRDGGRTWKAIPAPVAAPDTLSSLRFANLRDGFVAGTRLWATHDGGRTWKVVPREREAFGLQASAGRVWTVSAAGLRSAPVGGGAFVTEATGAQGVAVHEDLAVAVTDDGTRLLRGPVGGVTSVKGPCDRDDFASAVGLRTREQFLVVCASDGAAGSQPKRVFSTRDGGRTFTPGSEPNGHSGATVSATPGAYFLADILELQVTRDDGRTWTTSLSSDEAGLGETGFVSADLGFAIGAFDAGTDSMRISRDEGRTWSAVAFR